ncbi:secretory lipase-domain-containing protein [Neohortaea acidophila]|uniref:Secretory lipase-domain-containing protein n=1 Tax=Neohortaea acidophila TaxID=245834 RepID=A0A6A6Q5I2_9PEZI|nr:secretory lipase-domain-containing protein [Neohortaea acidophila]KAF2487708.1 secretory lipase-domain-containing protein [Neohortaea acidophila]
MMLLFDFLLAGALFLSSATALVAPSQDPFYTPPAGFASKAPGTVLRSRTVQTAFLGLVPNPVQGYQLLYRTTATNGSAIATVTTVFKPFGAALDKFVSFQTAYDSSDTVCDPSYNYQLGNNNTDLIVAFESLILESYILEGYIVSAPDYEGPDAAFSPGHLSGMGVLDSIRAVSSFASLGFTTSKPAVVAVGYSGGAIATGTASLQSTYAPELNIKGFASGGTPANLTGTLVFLDGELFSGFLPAALAGQLKPSAYQAELEPLYNKIITPFGRSKVEYADENCAQNDIFNFAEQSILSTKFQTLGEGLLYDPTISGIFEQNIMGIHTNQTPVAPVYLYHARNDEIIPYLNASTLYNNWCDQGATVHFTTFGNGGHLTTELLGVPSTLQFVNAAFAGTVAKGCSQQTVLNSTLNPLALAASLEPLAVSLIEGLNIAGLEDINIKNDLNLLKSGL